MFRLKQQPVYVVQQQPSMKREGARRVLHIAGKTLYATNRVGRWVSRRGYTHRRKLAPIYTAVALQTAAVGLHMAPGGVRTAVVAAVLGGVAFERWMNWWRPKTKRAIKRHESWWKDGKMRAWAAYGAGAAWTVAAVATTPGPPMPGFLGALMLGFGGLWWWHHRIRPKAAAEVLSDIDDMWETDVTTPGGLLPGSEIITHDRLHHLDDPDEEIGQKFHIQLRRGKMTTSNVISKTEQLASQFGVAPAEIAVEDVPSRRADQAFISIYKQDALKRVIPFTSPVDVFNSETGIASIASYPDGMDVLYRYYRRGSGPVHDLIAGTTGSGKSRLLDMLLAIERHSPLMTSVVIDPQGGQSLPDWVDAVPVFASTLEEAAVVIAGVEDEMYRRNKILANLEWVDSKGRQRKGKSFFDPTPEMPLLCLTIDEAHVILANAELAKTLENIAKMARKCGIKLRLVVQVPLLDQLGGSSTLRDMVAAGNVIVLRTANRLSGQVAFNGNLAADPALIPREFDDLSSTSGIGYSLGPGARSSVMRLRYSDDPYDWASTGELTTTGTKYIAALLGLYRERSEDESPEAQATVAQVTELTKAVQSEPKRVLAFLKERGEPAHTGVIADELGIPRANVSTACSRLRAKGEVVQVRHGIWVAAEHNTAANDEQQPVATAA